MHGCCGNRKTIFKVESLRRGKVLKGMAKESTIVVYAAYASCFTALMASRFTGSDLWSFVLPCTVT